MMRRDRLLVCCGTLGVVSAVWAMQPDASLVHRETIGESSGGRPILMIRLGGAEEDAPGVLVVAGLHSGHEIGRWTASAIVDRLMADHGDLLQQRNVYIVADLNPEGTSELAQGAQHGTGRSPRSGDADHDGRVSEDPAEDLNGDGLITMMRVEMPSESTGLTATHVVDEDEPRLMKKADGEKGEVGRYAMLVEGLDNDGDGKFNEDGRGGAGGGGLDLLKNFPAGWEEHADGSGDWALSDGGARALARWLLDHPNIGAVIVYGPRDSLVNLPVTGKNDQSGRVPLGIQSGDKLLYEQVAEAYKEITGITGGPKADGAGSLEHWAYAHLGIPAFSTPVWVRPDLVKGEDEKKEDGENEAEAAAEETPEPEAEFVMIGGDRVELTPAGVQAAMAAVESMSEEERAERFAAFQQLDANVRDRIMAMAQGQPDPGGGDGEEAEQASGGSKKGKGSKSEEGKWLAYSDDERGGGGFVAWEPFDHPQLGAVEIGGFVPGFMMNPPEDVKIALAEQQAAFVADVLGRLATLDVASASVSPLGGGLWRVSIRVTNTGTFPTATAMGIQTRRLPPTRLVIDVPLERIVSGEKMQRASTIVSGGHADASWIVRGDVGETIGVLVKSVTAGDQRVELTLEEVSQ